MGLAGLLTLITAVSVVKGRDTITDLDETLKMAIGVLLLLSLLAAAIGLWSALRAAYGWPEAAETTFPSQWTPLLRRAEEARNSLKTAVILTYITFALVVAAVGLTWYGSEDPPAFLSVTYTGSDGKQAKVCGERKPSDAKMLTLEPEGEKATTIALSDAEAVKVVASCG